MLMLGGGLLVLGVIVLLVSWLDIDTPYLIAGVMGAATLALMGLGWFLSLKSQTTGAEKWGTAGRALTFLA